MIRRLFRELAHPALKCERVGHRVGIEYREGVRRPADSEGWRYACMEVRQERPACRRCKAPLGGWRETLCEGFNGYSWPADKDRAFRRDGAVWDARGYGPASIATEAPADEL